MLIDKSEYMNILTSVYEFILLWSSIFVTKMLDHNIAKSVTQIIMSQF